MEIMTMLMVAGGSCGVPFLIYQAIGELQGIRTALESVATDPNARNALESR